MSATMGAPGERALFRSVSAWGVENITDDAAQLESGFHAVVVTFEGALRAVRFRNVTFHEDDPWAGARALGTAPEAPDTPNAETLSDDPESAWSSSMDEAQYEDVVSRIREHIADGTVYQVNACRMLSRDGDGTDMDGLFGDVLAHNPAPYACRIDVAGMLDIVSASPELFLARSGDDIVSAPIKGTAALPELMLDKDVAENIMITDLVRNDLQRVCEPGTVVVDPLLQLQQHPGLVHLVSTVRGRMMPQRRWADIFETCFPPGSVSGAPKSTALEIITQTEPEARGPYCGAIGWVDADSGRAELAVGIRTFWREPQGNEMSAPAMSSERLSFGTGAGITWHSDPEGEWVETQLKARKLVTLAQRHVPREEK